MYLHDIFAFIILKIEKMSNIARGQNAVRLGP